MTPTRPRPASTAPRPSASAGWRRWPPGTTGPASPRALRASRRPTPGRRRGPRPRGSPGRRTSRPSMSYGSGRSSTPFTTLNTAVLRPIPSPNVTTTTAVNAGSRPRPRRLTRRSFQSPIVHPPLFVHGHADPPAAPHARRAAYQVRPQREASRGAARSGHAVQLVPHELDHLRRPGDAEVLRVQA